MRNKAFPVRSLRGGHLSSTNPCLHSVYWQWLLPGVYIALVTTDEQFVCEANCTSMNTCGNTQDDSKLYMKAQSVYTVKRFETVFSQWHAHVVLVDTLVLQLHCTWFLFVLSVCSCLCQHYSADWEQVQCRYRTIRSVRQSTSLFNHSNLFWAATSLASFLGPVQLFVTCSGMKKQGELGTFSQV